MIPNLPCNFHQACRVINTVRMAEFWPVLHYLSRVVSVKLGKRWNTCVIIEQRMIAAWPIPWYLFDCPAVIELSGNSVWGPQAFSSCLHEFHQWKLKQNRWGHDLFIATYSHLLYKNYSYNKHDCNETILQWYTSRPYPHWASRVGYVPVDNQLCGGGGGDVIVAMETCALPWSHVSNHGDTWCHVSPWQPTTTTTQMVV